MKGSDFLQKISSVSYDEHTNLITLTGSNQDSWSSWKMQIYLPVLCQVTGKRVLDDHDKVITDYPIRNVRLILTAVMRFAIQQDVQAVCQYILEHGNSAIKKEWMKLEKEA